MAKKNAAEVLIGGKVYTISGYESTAYLHKVASYLNEMEEEVSAMDGYHRLANEEKQLLKEMNLVDAYIKASEEKDRLERENEQKDKEIYSLKHDLIDAKLEREKLEGKIQELEAELLKEQKRQNRLAYSASSRKIHRPEQRL